MENQDQPDYSQYAEMMQQTMAAALANVDAIKAEAQKLQEEAMNERAAAREERQRMENDARKLAEAYAEEHRRDIEQKIRKEVEDAIRQAVLADVVEALVKAGRAESEILAWLSASPEMLQAVRAKLGIRSATAEKKRVSYSQQGRGGTLTYHDKDISLTFDWEFGGGDALALIFVPTEAQWEAATGVPLSKRVEILTFVGTQVLADQGGVRYQLSDGILEILKS